MHKIMEFVLPVIAASAEAMIWVLLIGTLLLIGRGKLMPSEKTLIIERKGLYRMLLAPGLNLAQSFIEAVAGRLALHEETKQNGLSICFEVSDKDIATRKHPAYLLDISIRDDMLHFETRAVAPAANDIHHQGDMHSTLARIEEAVRTVAATRGISLRRISFSTAT